MVALREHLHLKASELEPLLAMSESTLARRVRQVAPLEPAPSERLDRLHDVISLACAVFEDPASTEAWLKAPHPPLPHGLRGDPGAAAAAGDRSGCPGLMQAWRLSKVRYAADLSGVGAARDGQRWNSPGQPAVTMGLTPEITVLELLVLLNGVISAPLMLCSYAIPHGQASASFAGPWLSATQQLGLVLPSVVVAQARNLLLNPLHPAITQVSLVDQVPFRLDRRLGGASLP